MLQKYIYKLKEKYDISFLELAKRIDVKYSTLNSIKDGTVKNASLSLLEKLAKFEGRDAVEILYDILYLEKEDELLKNHSKISLLFLCKLYLENYAVSESYQEHFDYFDKNVTFEGFAYKKRSTSNYIVIDSWNRILKEYLELFKNQKDLKMNIENVYHIYLYALGKFFNCTSDDIRRYFIIIEDSEIYSMIKSLKVKGPTTHVIPLYVKDIKDLAISE